MAATVDGFHRGERRSTYSAANALSVGPEGGGGKGSVPARLAGEERERRGAGLVGLHRAGLAEHDSARLAVAAEAEHPGPRTVGLDAEHEALQDGIVDRVFALAGSGRMRDRIGQAAALGHGSRPPAVEHVGKPARDPVRGLEHGPLGEMRVGERGLDVGMTEQPGDDAKALAAVDRDRRERVAQVVDAERHKPGQNRTAHRSARPAVQARVR